MPKMGQIWYFYPKIRCFLNFFGFYWIIWKQTGKKWENLFFQKNLSRFLWKHTGKKLENLFFQKNLSRFRGQNGGFLGPKWAKFGTFTLRTGFFSIISGLLDSLETYRKKIGKFIFSEKFESF